MIIGIGCDFADEARLADVITRRDELFLQRVFTPAERAYCDARVNSVPHYAARFAAKEALFKALGTGKVGRMAWHDVELAWPDGAREPAMTLSGETAAVAGEMGVDVAHVAMTTNREYGMAWVVVAGRGSCPGRFHLCSRDLRLSSLRADGKRPGHPRLGPRGPTFRAAGYFVAVQWVVLPPTVTVPVIVFPFTRPVYWAPSIVIVRSAPRSRPSVTAALVPFF